MKRQIAGFSLLFSILALGCISYPSPSVNFEELAVLQLSEFIERAKNETEITNWLNNHPTAIVYYFRFENTLETPNERTDLPMISWYDCLNEETLCYRGNTFYMGGEINVTEEFEYPKLVYNCSIYLAIANECPIPGGFVPQYQDTADAIEMASKNIQKTLKFSRASIKFTSFSPNKCAIYETEYGNYKDKMRELLLYDCIYKTDVWQITLSNLANGQRNIIARIVIDAKNGSILEKT